MRKVIFSIVLCAVGGSNFVVTSEPYDPKDKNIDGVREHVKRMISLPSRRLDQITYMRGSELAEPKLWRAQVSLRSLDLVHQCGGTFIAPTWVLTAAHCVFKSVPRKPTPENSLPEPEHVMKQPNEILVAFGGTSLAKMPDRINVKSIHVREKCEPKEKYCFPELLYRTSYENDIALLELEIAPSRTACYGFMELQNATDTAFSETSIIVHSAGWGRTPENDAYPDELRQITKIRILDQETCNKEVLDFRINDAKPVIDSTLSKLGFDLKKTPQFANELEAFLRHRVPPQITPSIVCAYSPETKEQTCDADSGGPLVAEIEGKRKQIGVVSGGDDGRVCAADLPGLYARIAPHFDWIQEKLGHAPDGRFYGHSSEGCKDVKVDR